MYCKFSKILNNSSKVSKFVSVCQEQKKSSVSSFLTAYEVTAGLLKYSSSQQNVKYVGARQVFNHMTFIKSNVQQ